MTAVYIKKSGTCLPCNGLVYANGVNPANPKACICFPGMTWSTSSSSCACSSSSSVIFLINGSYSCVPCTSVAGKNKLNPTTCTCYSNLTFTWTPNVGCVCNTPGAIIVNASNTLKCVVCSAAIYSSGVLPSGNSCACYGSLTWINSTLSCGCKSGQAIANSNGAYYYCVACGAAIQSKTTTTNNGTAC